MMQRKIVLARLLAGLVACSGFFMSAHATRVDDEKTAVKKEPWKPEDFIYGETAGQFRISPDAKWVVWAKTTGDKEKDLRVSNLVLSSLTESHEIPLTRGSDTNTQPSWSPDGEKIAFLSTRARPKAKPDVAPMQIWLMDAHGGEPWALTELAHAPKQIDWLDKDTLIYSGQEDPALHEQELKKKKDDSEVVDDADHEPPVRLYKINAKDGKITRLTANTDWIERFYVSKDGKYSAAIHAKSLHYVFDQKVPPVAILHNLTDGTEKQIFTEGRIRPYGFEWSPDNSGFYAWAPYSTDSRFLTASILLLYYYDVMTGKSVQVPLDWENGIGSDLAATPEGFVVGLAAGHRFEMARYTRDKAGDAWSWKRSSLQGDHAKNIESFEVSKDGKTIVYSSSTASRLSQPYRAQLEGGKLVSPVQLAKLNEGLVNGRAYAKSEVIRWKGANNEGVEGILYYPANYDAAKKYPLITAIHGGPLGADHDLWGESWAYPLQLFTERGAFVLRPNYHGSSNYGLKWAESICCGKYYDLETPDINAGVDFLIGQGKVDADRIATMGWSNGSILSTSLLVTYPARYKVASVGAGDIEWLSDWGNVDFGQSFDAYYFGKSPFEDPQLYINKSPFFKMDKVQAPVLIFHGTADRNVPPAQSWSYFRALQHFDKTVKYVVFPGEPHGPRKLTHQMRKVEEEAAWFDKYFFKTAKAEDEALKKDSPLRDLIRKDKVATGNIAGIGRVYATPGHKGEAMYPIPEIVQRGGLLIGRFEVTRAQFGEFDKNYKFDAGSANYPAGAISLERAQAYVDWLSKQTKDKYRLPYEDEVKSLYENREGENTLDYWAGYAPNPEDTAKLRERAKGLSSTEPLLKEVGSFAGKGKEDEEPIYDLGGNVAEWVLTRDGKGKVMGGSADCPADPKANCTPAPEYVGLRVVHGAAKPVAQ
jgi:dipeptidyl aminopeptidase/acylaminoacyl peptidase